MSRIEFHLQRCANHWKREAAARCPGCSQYFCRECVTEHDDRMYCAVCLARIFKPAERRKRGRILVRAIQLLFSFLILWLFFFYTGQALLMLPNSFHEGTIWEEAAED